MASTGSVDGWPLDPTELGEAGLRVLLRLPTQASSSYTELKSSCARHDVRIRISRYTIGTSKHQKYRVNELIRRVQRSNKRPPSVFRVRKRVPIRAHQACNCMRMFTHARK